MPSEFYLGQNYPEPFTERTTIKYCIPQRCRVILTIRDSGGAVVRCLIDEEKQPGTYEVGWDARDFPAGTYIYELKAGAFGAAKAMVRVE